MPFGTYGQLLTAISDWLERTDLASYLPDFVRLGEIRVQRDLKLRFTEKTITGTLTGAPVEFLPMPSDFISARFMRIDTNPPFYLDLMSPDKITDLKAGGGTVAAGFAMVGLNMMLGPPHGSDDNYTLIYQSGIPALSTIYPPNTTNTNNTNWLLQNAPDLLLFAALLQATPFIKDDNRIQIWSAAYKGAFDSLKLSEWRARFEGGPQAMRPDVTPVGRNSGGYWPWS